MVALFDAWHFADSAETAIRLARFLASSRTRFEGFLDEPVLRRQALAGVLGFRGHLDEALGLVDGAEQPGWYSALPGEIAFARDSNLSHKADVIFTRWLRKGPLWPRGEAPAGGAPGALLYALPWWAARRDTLSVSQYARRADSAQRAASRPNEREMAQYGAEAALAYAVLSRGDTLAALRRFEALPHDVIWGALDRLTEGQILTRQGRDTEALKLFEEAFPIVWWGPARVVAALDAARAAERLGQRERATGHYQFVVDAWRHADPELQHYVDEARQGLARLTSEPRQ
jgi:tetratricopeptide (TPR) repeat protein